MISVNLSDTFKTRMKQDKLSFCVTISRREKDGAQEITSYMYGVFDHGWYEFQLKYWRLFFFPAKPKCQILLQEISDATNIVIYHAVTLEKSEKKSSLIQFHVLPCN